MVGPFGFLSKEEWSLVWACGRGKKKKKKTKAELFFSEFVVLGQIGGCWVLK